MEKRNTYAMSFIGAPGDQFLSPKAEDQCIAAGGKVHFLNISFESETRLNSFITGCSLL